MHSLYVRTCTSKKYIRDDTLSGLSWFANSANINHCSRKFVSLEYAVGTLLGRHDGRNNRWNLSNHRLPTQELIYVHSCFTDHGEVIFLLSLPKKVNVSNQIRASIHSLLKSHASYTYISCNMTHTWWSTTLWWSHKVPFTSLNRGDWEGRGRRIGDSANWQSSEHSDRYTNTLWP